MSVVERILELQNESGLKDKQFEINAGLSNGAIGKWKRGIQSPNIDSIIAVARYFKVSTDYILGLSDIRTPASIAGCLSEHEVLLIESFREADANGQQEIICVCRTEKRKAAERLVMQEGQA